MIQGPEETAGIRSALCFQKVGYGHPAFNPCSTKITSKNPGKTRRELLKIEGMITAATSAASLLGLDVQASAMKGSSDQKVGKGPPDDRMEESYDLRVDAAKLELKQGKVPHPANADEAQFPNGIANYSKGLPHDQFGET